jgi:hypothetical protein
VVLKSISGDGVASCFFTGDGRGQVFIGGADLARHDLGASAGAAGGKLNAGRGLAPSR